MLKVPTTVQRVWGGTLYFPEDCGFEPTKTPLLFSNFKKKAEVFGKIQEPLEEPATLPPLPEALPQADLCRALKYLPTLLELGYEDQEISAAVVDDPRGVLPFCGGEEEARARVQRWIWDDDRLREYWMIRNGMKGESYSSKFSPWLAQGCLSPRRVWKEVRNYEQDRTKNKSTYWLVFELTWRDFFIYMALSHCSNIFRKGGVTRDSKRSWPGSPDCLERWKRGETGDLLVDANMHELLATGWMSNRGRQNVASYLIFDLRVDWRYGAAHFEEHLLDYDPCSNWGNWVAAAGLTSQRVNKFNTVYQLERYDPNHAYVLHWLRASGTVWTPSASHQEAPSEIGSDSSSSRNGGKMQGKVDRRKSKQKARTKTQHLCEKKRRGRHAAPGA